MSIISSDITKAKELLEAGEVVAIPTETVYGLAANIFNESAVKKIFDIKQRPLFNPLIVHIHDLTQLQKVAIEIPEKAKKLADKFWPGPLTLVLKKRDTVPDLITAGKDTVAVRIPNHSVSLNLLKHLDFPLAAPSANPFNAISPTSAEHVAHYFSDQLKMVLQGGTCTRGLESSIVAFDGDEVILLRLGSISAEEIESEVGKLSIMNKATNKPTAPGMLSKHYSPATPFIKVENIQSFINDHPKKKIGIISFNEGFKINAHSTQIILSPSGDLREAASKLYSSMHQLDLLDLDLIITESFPDRDLGRSINDRISRATK